MVHRKSGLRARRLVDSSEIAYMGKYEDSVSSMPVDRQLIAECGGKILRKKIGEAISVIPDGNKLLMALNEAGGSIRGAAEIMGDSPQTVRDRVLKLRKILRSTCSVELEKIGPRYA